MGQPHAGYRETGVVVAEWDCSPTGGDGDGEAAPGRREAGTRDVYRRSAPTHGWGDVVEARTTDPASVDVTAYIQAVTDDCPYLAPSLARGLTGWSVYGAVREAAAVEAEVFHTWSRGRRGSGRLFVI